MKLLSPFPLGPLELPNRMTMSALTRCRAVEGNVPNPLAVTYYAQRASAGLILTEATQVTPMGQGYPNTPGIHSDEQVRGWIKVTDAVHRAGGRMFLQLWHVGRVSHPDFHGGQLPVAPSALPVEGELFTPAGERRKIETPRALELLEIPQVVQQYKTGAENAMAAGFDGVEIHGANGYLLEQFTKSGTNHRADAYGGSLMNRLRFPWRWPMPSPAVGARSGWDTRSRPISTTIPCPTPIPWKPSPIWPRSSTVESWPIFASPKGPPAPGSLPPGPSS